jgi:hypothetical protein
MSEEQQYPSIPDQAANLAKFSFNVVRAALNSDDSLLVSEEIREKRWETCRSCQYYDPRQLRCRHCGCFLEAKIRFAIDSCPLQKWTINDENWVKEEYGKILDVIESREMDAPENQQPGFPNDAYIGELHRYVNEDGEEIMWQYDGKIWRLIN